MPTCSKDGFPKVKINGRWECVAEYLDRCIGNQRIVDVIEREETVYYVFESGHELPMLCYCCGEPLIYTDLEAVRRNHIGRRLRSMTVEPTELQDGQVVPQFSLELTKRGPLSSPLGEALSPEAAAQMVHPPGCPYGQRVSPPGGQRKGRRKKRRR